MLQIDHVYEFLYQEIFKQFNLYHLPGGVTKEQEISCTDIVVFTQGTHTTQKIFFYDQEPLVERTARKYLDFFLYERNYTLDALVKLNATNKMPYKIPQFSDEILEIHIKNPATVYKGATLVTSEHSALVNSLATQRDIELMYYFFHGFAALDWYRGHYALNYNKTIVKPYKYDFITFNRIINNDRSYRIYFVSQLREQGLLEQGQVSFGVTDNLFDYWQDEVADPASKLSEQAKLHIERNLTGVSKLVIDHAELPGSASADIPRSNCNLEIDSFWHIVTETVFYYDKLHLTEKIFKPIVSKQPFMLLAAPGNLEYLRSYGFKTFEGIIDESYDTIQDHDARVDAVVAQLAWYCSLSAQEKNTVIERLAPIVEYNFHHFYGEFRHIITRELLDNTRTLFKEIGYDDSTIAYEDIYKVLTN